MYDCLLYIFSYLHITKLCQLTCLGKSYHNVIRDTIKLYSPKKIKKSIRYSITIDNLSLFILLQSRISEQYLYCLLRYACCRKNEVFVNHIIHTFNMESYIGILCVELMRHKDVENIIHKLYFQMLIRDIRGTEKINHKYNNLFNHEFHYRFYKSYPQLYDEFGYRWMMFNMELV